MSRSTISTFQLFEMFPDEETAHNEDEYSFHLTLEAESQLKELIVKLMGQGLAGVER